MANPLLDQREACAELPDEAVADAPAIRHQQALVVGIGQYPHVAPLANAANDARDVGKLLQDEYGFELLPRGRVCLDGEATLASLQQAMRDSLAQAGPETRWLFYFAGHGMAAGDALAGDAAAETQGYLLPVDAQRGQPATWLRLSELVRACLESACAQALIILDACYSGSALIRPNDLDDSIPVAAAAATGAPGRAHRPDPHITRRVVQIVSSGNPAQPVMDGGGRGHSVFTQSLLEALQGWAGIHEEDDGRLRFSRLLDHLVFDVPGRLRALNYSTTSQRPIGGYLRRGPSEQGDFTFRPWSGRLPARIVQAARADDPSWRQKALADLSVAKDDAARRPAGVQLASAHTLRSGGAGAPFLVTGFLDYEPVAAVRSQAAATLGELGDPAAAGALLALLDDEPPVCRTAARALARLHLPQAAGALAQRLEQAPDDLFLDLVEAIGMLAAPGSALAAPGSASADPTAILSALHLALQKKKLVPVIGPDFPAGLTGLPERARLASGLAQRAQLSQAGSLAAAAAESMRGTPSRHDFTAYLRRALDDQLVQPGPVYRRLARLNVPFWLSGTYDGLLGKALKANSIVLGSDTQYWQPERPTVVRLLGDLAGLRGEVVIASDYAALRQNEGDRKLLVSFLRQELEGKVVLFLGFDPASPDFVLLVEHILNNHLAGVAVCSFLVWPEHTLRHAWSGRPLIPWVGEVLPFLDGLAPSNG